MGSELCSKVLQSFGTSHKDHYKERETKEVPTVFLYPLQSYMGDKEDQCIFQPHFLPYLDVIMFFLRLYNQFKPTPNDWIAVLVTDLHAKNDLESWKSPPLTSYQSEYAPEYRKARCFVSLANFLETKGHENQSSP